MKLKTILLSVAMVTMLTNVFAVTPFYQPRTVMAAVVEQDKTLELVKKYLKLEDKTAAATGIMYAIKNPDDAWGKLEIGLQLSGVNKDEFRASLSVLESNIVKEDLTKSWDANVALAALENLYTTTTIPDASTLPDILDKNSVEIDALLTAMSGVTVYMSGTSYKIADTDLVRLRIENSSLSKLERGKAISALETYFPGGGYFDAGNYASIVQAMLGTYGVVIAAPPTTGGGGGGGGVTPTPPTTVTTTGNETTVAVTPTQNAQGEVVAVLEMKPADIAKAIEKPAVSSDKKEVSQLSIEVKETTATAGKPITLTIAKDLMAEIAKSGIDQLQVKLGVNAVIIPSSWLKTNADYAISIGTVASDKISPDVVSAANSPSAKVFEFTMKVNGVAQNMHFDKLAQISFGALPAGATTNNASVYYFNPTTKALEARGGIVKDGKISAFTTGNSTYVVKVDNKTFADLAPVETWAKDPINAMASKGIITGRDNKNFDPQAKMTRAELMSVAVRLVGALDSSATCEGIFTDVKSTDWFNDEIASLYRVGITMKGGTKTSFMPNESVTRQDMMTLMASILYNLGYKQITDTSVLKDFTDSGDIATANKADVALLVQEKLITGIGNKKLGVNDNLTRAEAASVMYAFLNNVK